MAKVRILVSAVGGLFLVGAATALAAPGSGYFSVSCELSHRLPHDPIVHPHHPGASHSHEFYGNRSTNAHSTLASMRGAGTTCKRGEDKSGYWIPTLYKYGTAVEADSMTVYYRTASRSAPTVQPLPDGLQMIAGDADAKEVQDDDFVDWTCTQGNVFSDSILGKGAAKHRLRKARARLRRVKKDRDATRRALRAAREDLKIALLDVKPSSLPSCPNGGRIHLTLNFPDCWDGRRLDSADHKSHMFYSEWSAGEARCPASHPVPVPAISFSISWPVGDGRGARLASGPVRTMHGDVFSAWDPGMLASHVVRCLHAEDDCGSK
jgi:hypothetical protein